MAHKFSPVGLHLAGSRRGAFTLIETLLVLGILALLATALVISFSGWRRGVQAQEGSLRMETALRLARADAANTGKRLRLSFDSDSGDLKVLWEADPLNNPGVFTDYTAASWPGELPADLVHVSRCHRLGMNANPLSDDSGSTTNNSDGSTTGSTTDTTSSSSNNNNNSGTSTSGTSSGSSNALTGNNTNSSNSSNTDGSSTAATSNTASNTDPSVSGGNAGSSAGANGTTDRQDLTFYPDGSSDSAVIELAQPDPNNTDNADCAVLQLDGLSGNITSRLMTPQELDDYHQQGPATTQPGPSVQQ